MSAFLRLPKRPALLLVAAVLAACAPVLDWRDVRIESSALRLQLPCKPLTHRREVALAGAPVKLALHACEAGGLTWALAVAELGDAARVGPALSELAAAAAANLGAPAGAGTPLRVPGATPHPASALHRLQGRTPEGKPLQMQLAVFSHGTQVFQATVLGAQIPAEGAQTFFDSLRVNL